MLPKLFLVVILLGAPLVPAKGNSPIPSNWIDTARALPVLAEGRLMPLETWARILYSRISGRDNDSGAVEWVLRSLVFPEEQISDVAILVNDPGLLADLGISLNGRRRATLNELAPLVGRAPEWINRFSSDTSSAGKESLRLAAATLLAVRLQATFSLEASWALESPFLCLDGLNPAQALSIETLSSTQRDRLALLLLWQERARSGSWEESRQAMELLAGSTVWLEVLYNKVPWPILALTLALAALTLYGVARDRFLLTLTTFTVLEFLLATVWIVVRMLISGRPPVTDLASTFLLVSWLLSATSLALNFVKGQRPTSMLCLQASGLVALLVLAFQGGADPFSPLQAVLNTNFWLGLHVTMIVSGYAATLFVGLLGHAYLFMFSSRKTSRHIVVLWKNLSVGLVLALTLVVVGTLLGGIWADQSWGRFWGWDPKENGALLIILWLTITLHLKPSGLVSEWGVAWGAAAVVPVLLLSWMGVNLLGLGFHSYGAAIGKALLFWGLISLDGLILAFFALRRVLR